MPDCFVELFLEGVAKLKIGDPMERDTKYRSDGSRKSDDRVSQPGRADAGLVRFSRQAASRSKVPATTTPPTVLDNVKPDMVAFCEETFGPVAAIIRVKDVDEAVRLANQTEFGLGSAPGRQTWSVPATSLAISTLAPFSSTEWWLPIRATRSAALLLCYGRELGVYGIREFGNIKTVWLLARPSNRITKNKDTTMSEAAILRPKELKTNDWGGGARTTLVTRKCAGSNQHDQWHHRLRPRRCHRSPLQAYNCEESVMVIEGQAIAEIDGVQHHLDTNDTT